MAKDQMIRIVWRIVQDRHDFEDAFQEALTRIWKRLDRISRHQNPHALVLRICANAGYDLLRKRTRDRLCQPVETLGVDLADPGPPVADAMSRREVRVQILQAIGRLPRKQAQAVLMRFAQQLPYPEIAQALACSEVAARKCVSRARAHLRVVLEHHAPHLSEEMLK